MIDNLVIHTGLDNNSPRALARAASLASRLESAGATVAIVPACDGLDIRADCARPRDIYLSARVAIARIGFLYDRDIEIDLGLDTVILSQDDCASLVINSFNPEIACPVCGGRINHFSGIQDEDGSVYPVDYCQDCDFSREA